MDTKTRKLMKKAPNSSEQTRKFHSLPTIPPNKPSQYSYTDELRKIRKQPVLSKISEEQVVQHQPKVITKPKSKHTAKHRPPTDLAAKVMEPKFRQPPKPLPSNPHFGIKRDIVDRIRSYAKPKSKPKAKPFAITPPMFVTPTPSPKSPRKAKQAQMGIKSYINGFQKLINRNLMDIFKPHGEATHTKKSKKKKNVDDELKIDVVYSRQLQVKEKKRKRPKTAAKDAETLHMEMMIRKKQNEIALRERIMDIESGIKKPELMRKKSPKKSPKKPKKLKTASKIKK